MASHDEAWDIFRSELRHWMELRRITNKGLADSLNSRMKDGDTKVDAQIVKRWRHSTAPPLGLLRHIATILGMSEDRSGRRAYDPTYLLRRMDLISEAESNAELFDTAYRLQELQTRLMDVRAMLSTHTARSGAGQLVQLAISHGYAAATYPVWEGPVGYPMHVSDRLDFRPARNVPDDINEHADMRAALAENFVVPGARRPRFSSTQSDLDEQTHWAIPLIGRPFTRTGTIMHPAAAAIAVTSSTPSAWTDDIGAILAWLLGYGFTSTREIVRELTRDPIAAEPLRNDVHEHFLSQTPTRHVWSHHAGTLLDDAPHSPWAPRHPGGTSTILHVRLVEDDAVIDDTAVWMSNALSMDVDEAVTTTKNSRDTALARLQDPELAAVKNNVITVPVHLCDTSEARWEQAFETVLQVSHALAERGLVPDLTALHDRFLREEPEVAPSVLRWLADHQCPIVNSKFSSVASTLAR